MYELLISDLPRECIMDCSGPGSADAAVDHWVSSLNFAVPRADALRGLREYGAWPADELAAMSDRKLAEITLWLACGNFREYITKAEAAGIDPFRNRPGDFDPNCGSDLFTL